MGFVRQKNLLFEWRVDRVRHNFGRYFITRGDILPRVRMFYNGNRYFQAWRFVKRLIKCFKKTIHDWQIWTKNSLLQSLKLQWKSMHSIWLIILRRIEIRESFLCLLVSGYTMVLCAKSTIARSYILCSVQYFSLFFHGSVSTPSNVRLFSPLLLNLNLLLRIETAVCLATQTKHFSASKIFHQ